MAEEIKFLRFQDWVRHMFDHEASEPKWYFEAEAPVWIGPPDLNVEYITRLFEDPVSVLSKYKDAQLNQGFRFLVSNGASDCMFALMEESISIEKRFRCLKSFVSVLNDAPIRCCGRYVGRRIQVDLVILPTCGTPRGND
jgi:hypothetical protein